ncbi:hypothetical protein ScPMuIL_004384 [Solemya velum]
MEIIEAKWILLQRYLSNMNFENINDSPIDQIGLVPDVIQGVERKDVSPAMSTSYDMEGSRVFSTRHWEVPHVNMWNNRNKPDHEKLQDRASPVDMNVYVKTEDLTHLVGPLSEASVMRCLQARLYAQQYQTRIGPTIVCVNCNRHKPSQKVLCGSQLSNSSLQSLMSAAMENYTDTGSSQAFLVNGSNGSGKTYCAMQLLRQLFDIAGGGPETDAFKHLSATLTVLRSLGSAATVANPDSTRMGCFIENFISGTAIYRTKIHCYFLDQDRLCNVRRKEKNYHIFYQMLAGLSQLEKAKLHLTGYSVHNVRYLSSGLTHCNEMEDTARFEAWKSSLSVLGIPLSDVLRILAAVLLLGNIEFVEGPGLELDIVGNNEIKAVAALLGVSGVALYRGFTIKTHNSQGQVCKSMADVQSANKTRDNLAKALYVRTVTMILKRANNLRQPNPTLNSSLSISMDSVDLNTNTGAAQGLTVSRHSSISQCGRVHDKSKQTGFISILDMFGFESNECNHLEQLCMNLCAEKMQLFYNKQIFQDTAIAMQQENIETNVDINIPSINPVVELISSPTSGILDILDAEGMQPRCTALNFIKRVKLQHRINNYFFEPLTKECESFGVRHFAGKVVYEASEFLDTNRDVIADDIVCIFSRQNCNFGFASHLFSKEIKTAYDGVPVPRGLKHRILPRGSDKAYSSQSTLSQDFNRKLDSLLNILSHAKSHFVNCIKSNGRLEMDSFDPDTVRKQIRSLKILETAQLMAGGLAHKQRFRAFNKRYQMFLQQVDPYLHETQLDRCKALLNCFLQAMDESHLPYVSTHWSLGEHHIFYSEGTRQQLEAVRSERLHLAAVCIQSVWKGWRCRLAWSTRRKELQKCRDALKPKTKIKSDHKDNEKQIIINDRLLQELAKINRIDLGKSPSLPPQRNYSITGNIKLGYPQKRTLKEDFPKTAPPDQRFWRGEEVRVIGPSPQQGHLVVESRNFRQHVPYHLLYLQTVPEPDGMDI